MRHVVTQIKKAITSRVIEGLPVKSVNKTSKPKINLADINITKSKISGPITNTSADNKYTGLLPTPCVRIVVTP